MSFRTQLTLLLVGLVLAVSAVLGGFVYQTMRVPLESHAVSQVSLAADLYRQSLRDLLTRQNLRATRLLGSAYTDCIVEAPRSHQEVVWSRECLTNLLQGYAYAEGTVAVQLTYPDGPPIRIGKGNYETLPSTPSDERQLAWMDPPEPDGRTYRITAQSLELQLSARYDVARIRGMVPGWLDLGETGEVFVTDAAGDFITEPRYGADLVVEPSIDPAVLQRCLAGDDSGLSRAEVYGSGWIHGFRYLEAIGGGCVMAHLRESEVFAPIDTLRTRILWTTAILAGLAALLAALLARRFAGPLQQLTKQVQALQNGRYQAPIRSKGSAELRTFADSFTQMAASIRTSERRLREAEARHRLVLENTLDAFVGTDAEGRVTHWNPQAEILFDWPREKALGQYVDQLIQPVQGGPEGHHGFQRFVPTLRVDPDANQRREIMVRHRDGHELPVEITVTPVTVSGAQFHHAFIRDLSAARQAEAERARMARINTAITDNATLALFLMNDRHECTYMNPAAERMTGYGLAEVTGVRIHDLMHHTRPDGEPFPADDCPIDRAQSQTRRVQGEEVFVHKKGHFYAIAYTVSPIVERGQVVGSVVEVRDTSAERRLREAQRFLAQVGGLLGKSLDLAATLDRAARLAVSHMADVCSIKLVDNEGNLQRAALVHRDAAKEAQLIGYLKRNGNGFDLPIGSERALRTGQSQLVPELSPSRMRSFVRTHPHLESLPNALGAVSLIAVPMKVSGRVIGAITFMTTSDSNRRYSIEDLHLAEEFTRRCALAVDNAQLFQQAQEAVHLRDEFLSIASHELKTPLTPLRLQLGLLQRQAAGLAKDAAAEAELTRRATVLQRQNERLIRLVDELLDISRIMRGRLQLKIESVDLADVVHAIVDEHREGGAIEQSGSTVEVSAPEPVIGRWDRLRVEQIVANLLTNALKYGAGQPIRLEVACDGRQASLTVIDRGIGIDEAHQKRIFSRFERAVPVHNYGGLGLGLYIVRQVVEAMEGRIDVHSQPGLGSRFTVTLPLTGPQQTPPDPQAKQ